MNIDDLDRRIRHSIWFVSAASFLAPAVYMLWFWVANNHSISNETGAWGELGDFIGGIANPVIAFFAFYWLATSVLLQKTELAETRKSLEESKNAQEEQAKTVLISTKLQYLNIQLEAINSQIEAERSYINQLIQQAQIHGTQYTVVTRSGKSEMLKETLPEINDLISGLSKERARLMSQVEAIAPDLA